MNITTKYNIGDEVWYIDDDTGKILKDKIIMINIVIDSLNVHTECLMDNQNTLILLNDIYPTLEAAQAECERRKK